MKKIIMILFFLAALPLNLYPQWTQLSIPTSNDLYSVFFNNATTGYVSGSLNGNVIKTTDGGTTWAFFSADTTSTFYDMYFSDLQTGVIGGSSKQIYLTTNGGENWNLTTSGSGTVYSIAFKYPVKYAASSSPTLIDKSTDGGNSWVSITPPTTETLKGCWFIGNTLGWVCGSNGTLWKTIDGCVTWISQQQDSSYNFEKLCFYNFTTGFVVGSGGVMLKTTDSGESWSNENTETTNTLYDVTLYGTTLGWAVGENGIILKTWDGGDNWYAQNTPTSNTLYAIQMSGSNNGYIVGSGGVVLRTNNGGGPPIGVISNKNEIPDNYALMQNYPNPFNPNTIIKYLLPKSSFVTLTVYDNIGNEITKLVNASQSAGYYEIDFNGENLGSGIYFYKITADNFTASRKMVLIK